MMRSLLLLFLTLPCISMADSWVGETVTGHMSPDAEKLVRIIPGDSWGDTFGFSGEKTGAYSRAVFYERNRADQYLKTREIELLNPVRPVDVFLTDAGELVTFDNWHNMGYGDVVAVYDANGDLVVSYTLDELYPDESSRDALPMSVSSIWWRCGEPLFIGTSFTVLEANGGSFRFEMPSGKFEYEPGEGSPAEEC